MSAGSIRAPHPQTLPTARHFIWIIAKCVPNESYKPPSRGQLRRSSVIFKLKLAYTVLQHGAKPTNNIAREVKPPQHHANSARKTVIPQSTNTTFTLRARSTNARHQRHKNKNKTLTMKKVWCTTTRLYRVSRGNRASQIRRFYVSQQTDSPSGDRLAPDKRQSCPGSTPIASSQNYCCCVDDKSR